MKQENRNATFLSMTCKRVRAFRNASAQLLLPFSRQIKKHIPDTDFQPPMCG